MSGAKVNSIIISVCKTKRNKLTTQHRDQNHPPILTICHHEYGLIALDTSHTQVIHYRSRGLDDNS